MAELTSVILLTRAAAAANRNAYKANPSTNHATASPMSPAATVGTPILSVTRNATAGGVASTTSCTRVAVPTAITVPTSTWLGRRMASSTSEMRVDFSIATVVAIAVPASVSDRYNTMPTATPTPTRPVLSTGPAMTCLGARIDWRSATCRGLSLGQLPRGLECDHGLGDHDREGSRRRSGGIQGPACQPCCGVPVTYCLPDGRLVLAGNVRDREAGWLTSRVQRRHQGGGGLADSGEGVRRAVGTKDLRDGDRGDGQEQEQAGEDLERPGPDVLDESALRDQGCAPPPGAHQRTPAGSGARPAALRNSCDS